MDPQKHAMLYQPLDPNAVPYEQRAQAAAAMGLPVEPPPTYDAAMAGGTPARASNKPTSSGNPTLGWTATTPHSSPVVVVQQPHLPMPQSQPHQHQHDPQQLQSSEHTSTTVTVPHTQKLGPNPCAVTCPVCGTCKTTRMSYTPNTRTHVCALILCLVGWCCCACFVPYCLNSCRTGNHYCSQCNTYLGSYHPRSRRCRRR